MKLVIVIEMDNDAFSFDAVQETERILNTAVDKLRVMEEPETKKLYDYNGNSVGYMRFET